MVLARHEWKLITRPVRFEPSNYQLFIISNLFNYGGRKCDVAFLQRTVALKRNCFVDELRVDVLG